MSELPDPPIPPECTMAGHDWYPLKFDRLRASKWWRRASDLARARNVMMWGEAYKATPAGSLPDDDDELAEAAGFGMDVEAFIAAKAEIMAPWKLCSDGRWYHPTVSEMVLEAWERKSESRKAAAERQRRRRDKARGVTPPEPPVTPPSGGVTRDDAQVTRDAAENGRDSGTQDKTGQNRQENPPLPPDGGHEDDLFGREDDAEPASRRKPRRALPDGFPDAAAIAEQQAKAAAQGVTVDAAYQAERFRNWSLGKDQRFADWPAAWRNWMAKAVQDAPKPARAVAVGEWPGPAEVKAAVEWGLREYAASYLARCAWRDLPDRALVTASAAAFDRINRDAGDELERIGVKLVLEQGRAA